MARLNGGFYPNMVEGVTPMPKMNGMQYPLAGAGELNTKRAMYPMNMPGLGDAEYMGGSKQVPAQLNGLPMGESPMKMMKMGAPKMEGEKENAAMGEGEYESTPKEYDEGNGMEYKQKGM